MTRDSYRVLFQLLKNGPSQIAKITNRNRVQQLVSSGHVVAVAVMADIDLYAATPSGAVAFRTYMSETDLVMAIEKFARQEVQTTN